MKKLISIGIGALLLLSVAAEAVWAPPFKLPIWHDRFYHGKEIQSGRFAVETSEWGAARFSADSSKKAVCIRLWVAPKGLTGVAPCGNIFLYENGSYTGTCGLSSTSSWLFWPITPTYGPTMLEFWATKDGWTSFTIRNDCAGGADSLAINYIAYME